MELTLLSGLVSAVASIANILFFRVQFAKLNAEKGKLDAERQNTSAQTELRKVDLPRMLYESYASAVLDVIRLQDQLVELKQDYAEIKQETEVLKTELIQLRKENTALKEKLEPCSSTTISDA